MYRIKTLLFVVVLYCGASVSAQNVETDSLKRELAIEKNDQKRVYVLEGLSYAYLSSYPDTALQYALQGLQLAQNIKFLKGEATCTDAIGNVYFHIGDNAKALEMYLRYLSIKESSKDFNHISVAYFNIGNAYTEEGDYNKALYYFFKAKAGNEKEKDTSAILYDIYSLGNIYLRMRKTDSALYYINQSYQLATDLDDKNMIGAVLSTFGEIYLALNDTAKAAAYYRMSIPHMELVTDNEGLASDYFGLAKIYKEKAMLDSSIHYARDAFYIAQNAPFFKQAFEISSFLGGLFKTKNKYDSAFHYQELSIAIKDSLFNVEQVKKIQNLKFQEQQRQQSIEAEKIKYQNTIKLFIAITASVIILIIAVVLYRNNREKLKANVLLTEQKNKVESAFSELKSTQALLIQSEKMASLGELTAGIAHEIQNPLNFVNNFTEVNSELIDEMTHEAGINEMKALAHDVKQNNEKIAFHGKRADAIVKGMLQHSRATRGMKEPTDINKLADEYLRLAYHGFRAKDKTFKAKTETNFDSSLEKINVIPQDIGRVILNLINNALYAVAEKKQQSGNGNEPIVRVSTKRNNSKVEIRVTDNGNGIHQKILEKIFQPFFTTKPTGQGTGLGLSLAYDIIKAHGGEIRVKTKEGEGSEFIIQIPLS